MSAAHQVSGMPVQWQAGSLPHTVALPMPLAGVLRRLCTARAVCLSRSHGSSYSSFESCIACYDEACCGVTHCGTLQCTSANMHAAACASIDWPGPVVCTCHTSSKQSVPPASIACRACLGSAGRQRRQHGSISRLRRRPICTLASTLCAARRAWPQVRRPALPCSCVAVTKQRLEIAAMAYKFTTAAQASKSRVAVTACTWLQDV